MQVIKRKTMRTVLSGLGIAGWDNSVPAAVVTNVSTRVTSWLKPIYGRTEAEELGTVPESDLEGKLGLVVCDPFAPTIACWLCRWAMPHIYVHAAGARRGRAPGP